MLIDGHQHFWRYDPRVLAWMTPDMLHLARDWMPHDYAEACRHLDVSGTIAVQARSDEDDNRFLLGLAQDNPWILGIVGWVDLAKSNCASRLDYWCSQGPLVGIRHQIENESNPDDYMNNTEVNRSISSLQHDGLVYELLLKGNQLALAAQFCSRHDQHTIVLDHLGKPDINGGDMAFNSWKEHMLTLSSMPHVAVKISGLVTEAINGTGQLSSSSIQRYLNTALELFGVERLIYGSDWPVCLLACPYDDVYQLINLWADVCSEDEQALIFGKNAQRIYGISTSSI